MPSKLYSNTPSPPDPKTERFPSDSPLQLTLFIIVTTHDKAGFSVTMISQAVVHPLTSVMITVCNPAASIIAVAVFSPLSHA